MQITLLRCHVYLEICVTRDFHEPIDGAEKLKLSEKG